MTLFTGSYYNCKGGNLVSISGDRGKSADFVGASYTILAPKKDFFRVWKDNKTKLSEDENNLYYMREFYTKVLSKLDPKQVFDDLSKFGDTVVILCYEDSFDFCHRHLVAVWLEKELNIEIPEIAIDEDDNVTTLSRNPKYTQQFCDIMNSI